MIDKCQWETDSLHCGKGLAKPDGDGDWISELLAIAGFAVTSDI
jgi:hypothetical protein